MAQKLIVAAKRPQFLFVYSKSDHVQYIEQESCVLNTPCRQGAEGVSTACSRNDICDLLSPRRNLLFPGTKQYVFTVHQAPEREEVRGYTSRPSELEDDPLWAGGSKIHP